jgi:hypothetical protein
MYYYQRSRRIITESNIKDPPILQVLYQAMEILDNRLHELDIILSPSMEVALRIDLEQSPPLVQYYYVDHAQKTVLSLELNVRTKHYWTHVQFYPTHINLSAEVESEMITALTNACVGKSAIQFIYFTEIVSQL